MNKKLIQQTRGYVISCSLVVLLFFLVNCNGDSDSLVEPEQQFTNFPEFFMESGTDSDTSYISFRGTLLENDTLELQTTSWGVVETGLFLNRRYSNRSVLFRMMGICGTVESRTWEKVTLFEYLSPSDLDTLKQLAFTNGSDTLVVLKPSVR